jgi:hypothetical protein
MTALEVVMMQFRLLVELQGELIRQTTEHRVRFWPFPAR